MVWHFQGAHIVNGLLSNFTVSINKLFLGGYFVMNNIPTPLTLEEIIAQGGIEGSEEAYDDEYGFDYSGPDAAFLYYGGDEFSGGKPFTGVYYE